MRKDRKNKAPNGSCGCRTWTTPRGGVEHAGLTQSKRAYRFAIEDFVTWYRSEPRLAFSKTVVLRYRLELDARQLAPATINPPLGGGSPLGLRSGRHRAAQPGFSSRHPAHEGSQEDRRETRELAD